MVATTAFSARSGWSISPGIRWSVSRGTGGQFPPESGGQYQRILHIEAGSPFFQHIKVAPLDVDKLFPDGVKMTWVVSTATVVDGIGALISSNVKRDRILMQHAGRFSGRSRSMLKDIKDISPLRKQFIENQDKTIYDTIIDYFNAFSALFWKKAGSKSYIIKTVGVQAAFDLLKIILNNRKQGPENIDFSTILTPAAGIDFSDKFFQASGIGRSRIKNSIGIAAGLIVREKIKQTDLPSYDAVISGKSSDAERQETAWEAAAEDAVANALDRVQWNYDVNSVSLVSDQSDDVQSFPNFKSFLEKLVEIAQTAFDNALPKDEEFAGQQAEAIDMHELVRAALNDFEPNLIQLGWV